MRLSDVNELKLNSLATKCHFFSDLWKYVITDTKYFRLQPWNNKSDFSAVLQNFHTLTQKDNF